MTDHGTHPIARHADVVVVGGGTSGSVIANRLASAGAGSVVVLEAGPDYGLLAGGAWPADLLDGATIPYSHEWGYTSGASLPGRVVEFERAKVIGGCSTHNGCVQVWGHRLDYDDWAAQGNTGWSTD